MVSIDECGITTILARTHGRAKRGKRCEASIPFGHRHGNTLPVAMNGTGMRAPPMPDDPLDGNVFSYWIENMLVKEPSPGQVVICDSVAVHKVAGVREALAGFGVELLFPPPCSPDLNAIEKAFPRFKSHLGKVAAGTRENLEDATGKALDFVTPSIACNYFRGCGNSGVLHLAENALSEQCHDDHTCGASPAMIYRHRRCLKWDLALLVSPSRIVNHFAAGRDECESRMRRVLSTKYNVRV